MYFKLLKLEASKVGNIFFTLQIKTARKLRERKFLAKSNQV